MQTTIPLILAGCSPSKMDIQDIPFDAFYDFFEQNQDWKQGKIIGDLMVDKFEADFIDAELQLLPTGITLKSGNLKKDADHVTQAFKDQLEIMEGRTVRTLVLMNALQDYHLGNMWMNKDHRQQGLEKVKEVIEPFFTEHRKVVCDTPKAKKNLLQRLFA